MPMNGCTSPLEPTGVSRKCATCSAREWCDGGSRRRPPVVGHRAIESRGEIGELFGGACPSQRFDVIKKREVGPQRRERAEQERAIAFVHERPRQCRCS